MQEDGFPEDSTPSEQGPGQLLREARETAGLTVESIAYELRLTTEVIRSLEKDTLDRYKPTFIRGYLRAYARHVGVPAELVLQAYDRMVSAQSPDKPSDYIPPAPTKNYERLLDFLAQNKPDLSFARFRRSLMMPRWGVAAAAVVIVLGATWAWQRSTPAQVAAITPSEPAAAVPAEPAVADALPAASVVSGLAKLEMQFQEDCWVTVFDGTHARLATGMMSSQTPLQIEGVPPLRVMLGNAQAAKITFNGKTVDVGLPETDEMINLTLG